MTTKSLKILLALLVLVAAASVYWLLELKGKETTDDARFEADIVSVSAKVSGYVKELKVKDNQLVHAGDLLLTINPADYQIAVDKATAALGAAQAQYEQATQSLAATKVTAPSSAEAAKAAVAGAQADLDRAVKDAERNRKLKGVTASTRDIDESNTAEKVAQAKLEQVQAQLRQAETSPQEIAGADANTRRLAAQVDEKKAELADAQKDLTDTSLTAAVDGKITSRTVEIGAYVQPGQALMAISGANLWVVADFKETQLEHMHPGQSVDIKIDAFPTVRLTGKIDSIQAGTGTRLSLFPPENATGNFVKVVQRVPVKILLDAQPDTALAIAPGMSIEATVLVE